MLFSDIYKITQIDRKIISKGGNLLGLISLGDPKYSSESKWYSKAVVYNTGSISWTGRIL